MPSEVSTVGGDQSVEEVRRELADAREQLAATAGILAAISNSPTGANRVFTEIAASAARLCDAYDTVILQVDDDVLRVVGHYGSIPTPGSLPIASGTVMGRAVLERRTIHIADLQTETTEYPEGRDFALRLGFRTQLTVPLMRTGEAIGVMAIRRSEARPFTDRQIDLLKTFTDQAVIAIENARLFTELHEKNHALTKAHAQVSGALEREAATSEILRVIGSCPTDVQPVFETIARSGVSVCGALGCVVLVVDGGMIRVAATHGVRPERLERFRREYPMPLSAEVDTALTIRHRCMFHLADIENNPNANTNDIEHARLAGYRTRLMVPMVRGDRTLGLIAVTREDPTPFPDQIVELLRTFADQAVIAIDNTRLFEEVQARTRELELRSAELAESLEYQMATSEVLGVIARAPGNAAPVFSSIVETARRLCDADRAVLHLRLPDGRYSPKASSGPALQTLAPQEPVSVDRGSIVGRVAVEGRVVQVDDIQADPEFTYLRTSATDARRTMLGVPLLLDGTMLGAISISRSEVKRFTEREIALLETFASQAVIAIENARLFEEVQTRTRELTESLEYQTAISEVLGVISRSPNDLQPVLAAIVDIGRKLCDAERAIIWRFEADEALPAAFSGLDATRIAQAGHLRIPLGTGSIMGRAAREGRAIQVLEPASDASLSPAQIEWTRSGNIRTVLAVPLMREGKSIGGITVSRTVVSPFDSKQVTLLKTFADQAVIAIENTRLFEAEQARSKELRESLEYQTATSDVLGVISRSKFDLQPVLDSIVETAARLCVCDMATIRRREGDVYVQLGGYGLPAEYADYSRSTNWHHAGRGSLVGRVLQEGKAVQIVDALADPEYALDEAQRRGGFRTMLGVPLLRGDEQLGIIVLMRRAVRPFDNRQIELVAAFADQAVIAIENTRLFEEVQARTRELATTIQELEIASQHKSQFVANMSHELRTPLAAILGYAELMQEGFYEPLGQKSLDALTRIRSNGKHLLGLINTVLDIAKIEAGQFSLNLGEYALSNVVETVRAATESLAETKKLSLKTDVAKSLPIGFGDEQRLTQVLLNLVGNAIKFTDAGEVRISAAVANGHFTVSVVDTGPGIAEEHRVRIFEQFHQIDSSNTKAKGGTGLGLAIAKQIVEMHCGRIWVESMLGKGSIFRMELPVRAQNT